MDRDALYILFLGYDDENQMAPKPSLIWRCQPSSVLMHSYIVNDCQTYKAHTLAQCCLFREYISVGFSLSTYSSLWVYLLLCLSCGRVFAGVRVLPIPWPHVLDSPWHLVTIPLLTLSDCTSPTMGTMLLCRLLLYVCVCVCDRGRERTSDLVYIFSQPVCSLIICSDSLL